MTPLPPFSKQSELFFDDLGDECEFSCTQDSQDIKYLWCQEFQVHTHDYQLSHLLPTSNCHYVKIPPEPWNTSGVSAHKNTVKVARFIKEVLERNGIDNKGGNYVSAVNFTHRERRLVEFKNAGWHPLHNQVVYGQKDIQENGSSKFRSYGASLTIVAHEVFHGVIHHIVRLEGRGQTGALNESYSDIFAVLVNNFGNSDISQWDWRIGAPLGDSDEGRRGFPTRDLARPEDFGQACHMSYYDNIPDSNRLLLARDRGGVHFFNGIHNKAAFYIITSQDDDGRYIFNDKTASLLFYRALQRLPENASFSESFEALLSSAASLFKSHASNHALSLFHSGITRDTILSVVENAFDQVGINLQGGYSLST